MLSESAQEVLAIHGGPRAFGDVRSEWPITDEAVRAAVDRALADGSWGRYHAAHCEQLAAELAARHAAPLVTLCCSGTFAVELALRGLGVGPGDEVILAGYDFPGNFRAIEAAGARPVVVDVETGGWLLDPEQIAHAASAATRAVIVSHMHGGMADLPRIVEVARRLGLRVVEDACQAPGASVGGRVAGSWGDVGVLSFGGSKLLSAGRGGAILTCDPEVHQRARVFCQRGNHAFPISELQAAVLLPQLTALEQRNRRRRTAVERLLAGTADLPGLRPQAKGAGGAEPSYYKLAWHYMPEAMSGRPIEQFVVAAQAEGLPLDTGFRGFTKRGQKRCRKVGPLEHAQRDAEATLLLHHPVLLAGEADIDRLAQALGKVALAFARWPLDG